MPMSNKQLAMIHATKHNLGLEDFEYRGMLHQVAGVTSAKQLDQKGFERVMAWFERKGGRSGQLFQRAAESIYCSTRQIREMELLAAGRAELLASLTTKMSRGTASNPTKLRPWQAGKVIEALKAITVREVEAAAGVHPSGLPMLVRTWSDGQARLLEEMSSRDLVNLWRMLRGDDLDGTFPRAAGAFPASDPAPAAGVSLPQPLPRRSIEELAAIQAEDFDDVPF